MSKFKVGDRVVMIGTCGGTLIATLDRFIPDGEVFAGQWEATCADGDPAIFYEHQIELIGSPRPDPTTLHSPRPFCDERDDGFASSECDIWRGD